MQHSHPACRERQRSHAAVQDVIGEVSGSEARAAWYGGISSEIVAILSGKRLRPTAVQNNLSLPILHA